MTRTRITRTRTRTGRTGMRTKYRTTMNRQERDREPHRFHGLQLRQHLDRRRGNPVRLRPHVLRRRRPHHRPPHLLPESLRPQHPGPPDGSPCPADPRHPLPDAWQHRQGLFSPSLKMFSLRLGLPSGFSRVTLLALGNGAANVSATVNAITTDMQNGYQMALGALTGAGMFVGTIVAGLVVLAAGGCHAGEPWCGTWWPICWPWGSVSFVRTLFLLILRRVFGRH